MTSQTTHPAAHPFSLTAPVNLTLQPNQSGTFTVQNSGTQALTVRDSLGRYTLKSLHYPAADHATLTQLGQPWVTVSPQTFTLAPGASETVRIASHVPAGTAGSHYLNVVWSASPAHAAAGTVHLTGAVASNVIIPDPGMATPVTSQPLPHLVTVPSSGGPGTGVLAGGAVALVMVLLALVLVIRRLRTRRAAA